MIKVWLTIPIYIFFYFFSFLKRLAFVWKTLVSNAARSPWIKYVYLKKMISRTSSVRLYARVVFFIIIKNLILIDDKKYQKNLESLLRSPWDVEREDRSVKHGEEAFVADIFVENFISYSSTWLKCWFPN